MVSLGLKCGSKLDFSATSTWAESTISSHAFVDIDGIINGSLDIIEGVFGVTSQHNCAVSGVIKIGA